MGGKGRAARLLAVPAGAAAAWALAPAFAGPSVGRVAAVDAPAAGGSHAAPGSQTGEHGLRSAAGAIGVSALLVGALQRRATRVSLRCRSGEAGDAAACSRRPLVAGVLAPLLTPSAPALAEAPDAGGARLAALTPEVLARAKGKVFLVTGATAGVGLEASRNLVNNGAEVYMCGRTLEKAKAAVAEVTTPSSSGKAVPLELDLASFTSVRSFAEQWKGAVGKPIDVLALNAGMALKAGLKPEDAVLSKDGLEITVATNHFGHFLLYNLLQDQLSPQARVVVTASSVHNPATGDPGAQATLGDLSGLTNKSLMVSGGDYDSQKAYKDSKLCNVLFTRELARRLKEKGSQVTVNCLSPGLIPSKTFFRNQDPGFSGVFAFAARNVLKIAETTEFGGDTLTYMALDPSLDGRSGLFYSAEPPGAHSFTEKPVSVEAMDDAKAAELWKRSAAVVGL